MTWQFVIGGLAVGLLVGMTGMGGGSLMTPMLILLFGFDPKTAVGTDLLHGAVFKSFGAWRHRSLGNVHVPLALWMLVGSIPGVLLGSQLSVRVPERALRVAFAFVLILSGIKLVGVPAATTVIEVCVGLGALAFGAWSVWQLLQRRAPAEEPA